jgi:hypothetical protein
MLLATPLGVVSAAVEAKAGEKFDKVVAEWRLDSKPNSGKPARLRQLCSVLEITPDQADRCRYQLLHRPVAAILEARRFGLQHALFLVQSFAADPGSFQDFSCFARELGVDVAENRIVCAGQRAGVSLWIAWISSDPATDSVVAAAL